MGKFRRFLANEQYTISKCPQCGVECKPRRSIREGEHVVTVESTCSECSLNEAAPIKLDDVNSNPGNIPAVAFVGRFQPPTKAHANIIKQMKSSHPGAKPLLFIVRGVKSGQDKKKNPFSEQTQKDMIYKSTGVKNVLIIPSAFIGELVDQARNRNHEIVRLFAGTDRVKGYESQIDRYKEQLNIDIKVDEIKRSDEDISATKVRNALIDNDWDTFKKMTTKLDKKDFIRLQNEIKPG